MMRLMLLAAALLGWAALLASAAYADDADPQANPLHAIPLGALSATRDRPLFSPERRRPPPPAAVAPQPVAAPPSPPQPATAEPPPFQLVGTIVGAGARVALLLNRSTNAVTRLREGESELGWRASSVAARSIVLQRGGASATLELPKSNTGAHEAPPANPAAEAAPPPSAPPVGPTADAAAPRRHAIH